MDFLSQYFDVTTSDVLERILWSAVPIRKSNDKLNLSDSTDGDLTLPLTIDNIGGDYDQQQQQQQQDSNSIFQQLSKGSQKSLSYMERFIQGRPDFYGPIWITTTLIFEVAIFSNLVSFLIHGSKQSKASGEAFALFSINNTGSNQAIIQPFHSNQIEEWHYSMDELNMTASIIIFYVTVIPTLLWFLFWFRGCTKYYTLMETICAYSYSLSIFIPLAGLLMIQMNIIRYLVIVIASLLSGMVLSMSFLPIVRDDTKGSGGSHIILIVVPIFQFGLAYIIHRIMLVR